MVNKFIIYTLLLMMSCTVLIPKENLGVNQSTSDSVTQNNYCSSKTKTEFIDKGPYLQSDFISFINRVKKSENISNIDQFVLWNFFQMNSRPDLSSPTSKFISVYEHKDKLNFVEVSSDKEGLLPSLMGLKYVLKKTKNKKSLTRLSLIYEKYASEYLKINKGFAQFLTENKKQILVNPITKRIYSRSGEILQEGETIPKFLFSKLIVKNKKLLNETKYNINENLYNYKVNQKFEVNCNYDFKLYDSSIYLINEKFVKTNTFGIKTNKFSSLSSHLQKLDNIELLKGTYFFKGQSKTQSPSICTYKQNDKSFWLFSDSSRDPGQHLYHLMKYGLDEVTNKQQLNKFLNFSRHLILRTPLRLIFESKRGSKEQLDQLLKLNIPTYNADKLGNIWMYFSYQNDGSFLYDPRNDGQVTCQK